MIKPVNGIIPIEMLLNQQYYNQISISIYEKKGRTAKWVLTNNQPRRIFKQRKIKITIPHIKSVNNIDMQIVVCIRQIKGTISDKCCYLSNNKNETNSMFLEKIDINNPTQVEYYINTFVDKSKLPSEVDYDISIWGIINNQNYKFHSWIISPERSHKWESTKGKKQNEENTQEINIPLNFIEE